jgi:hypothetical protein
MRTAVVLVGLGFAFVGCGRSEEAVEAERVLRAIDVLRDAPSSALPARIELAAELERLPLRSPPAVGTRDACARAYRLLLDASLLEQRARKALDEPGLPSATAVQDLLEAETKVKESSMAMPECDRAMAELRRATR